MQDNQMLVDEWLWKELKALVASMPLNVPYPAPRPKTGSAPPPKKPWKWR